jgi:hypothetical protein
MWWWTHEVKDWSYKYLRGDNEDSNNIGIIRFVRFSIF